MSFTRFFSRKSQLRYFSISFALTEPEQLFVDWSTKMGIVCNKAAIGYRHIGPEEMRRGVFAITNIKKDEAIAALPLSVIFGRNTAVDGLPPALGSALLSTTELLYEDKELQENEWSDDIQYIELAILFLFQYYNPTSKFKDWFALLPAYTGNASVIQPHAIREIMGKSHSHVEKMISESQEYQAFLFSLTKHPLISSLLRLLATRTSLELPQLRARFLWAVSILDSRSFRGSYLSNGVNMSDDLETDIEIKPFEIGVSPRSQFMAPFFDFLNHPDTEPNVSLHYLPMPPIEDKSRFSTWKYILQDAGIELDHIINNKFRDNYRVILAKRDILAGEELFYSYSSSSEDYATLQEYQYDMLFGYGFLPKTMVGNSHLNPVAEQPINYNVGVKQPRPQNNSKSSLQAKIEAAARLGQNISHLTRKK